MPTVLIVDDAEDVLELAQIGFETKGWSCHTAVSGNAALDLLSRVQVDVILLDFELEGETGLEVLPRLKERGASIPVVFLTGRSDSKQHEEFLAAGAAGVLTKPFDPFAIADQTSIFIPK